MAELTKTLEVGDRLAHHSVGIWMVREVIGGPLDDLRLECVEGGEKGRWLVAHGEYVERSFRLLSALPETRNE